MPLPSRSKYNAFLSLLPLWRGFLDWGKIGVFKIMFLQHQLLLALKRRKGFGKIQELFWPLPWSAQFLLKIAWHKTTLFKGTLLCFLLKHCNESLENHSVYYSFDFFFSFFAPQSENHSTFNCAPTMCLEVPGLSFGILPKNFVNFPLCSLFHLRCVLLKTPAKIW